MVIFEQYVFSEDSYFPKYLEGTPSEVRTKVYAQNTLVLKEICMKRFLDTYIALRWGFNIFK